MTNALEAVTDWGRVENTYVGPEDLIAKGVLPVILEMEDGVWLALDPVAYQNGDDPLLLVDPKSYQNGDDPLLIPPLWPIISDTPDVSIEELASISEDLADEGGLLTDLVAIELDAGRKLGQPVLSYDGSEWFVDEYGLVYEVDAKTGALGWTDELGLVLDWSLDSSGDVVLVTDQGDKVTMEL